MIPRRSVAASVSLAITPTSFMRALPSRSTGCQGRLSADTILSTTPGAGLYFTRFWRSFVRFVSFVSYGRYSWTSRAHDEAFGTPAAVSALTSCALVALFAETFVIVLVAALVSLDALAAAVALVAAVVAATGCLE